MTGFDPEFKRWEGGDDADESPSLPEFLLDPWGVVRRRWPWLVFVLVAGLAATGVAVKLMPVTYIAEATILITRQQIPEEFVRSTVQDDSISNISAMVGEALSREKIAKLIRDQGLAPGVPDDALGALVADLRSRIDVAPRETVSRGRESSIIYGVDFRSEDPIEAAAVANALAGLFQEASIERRSGQARRTTAFLKRQLEKDEAELREQSALASEFRRMHRGELPSELQTNMRRLELLSERRQSLVTQIAAKENHIVTLEAIPTPTNKSESMLLLESLRAQLATESAVNTDEHPNVVALRDRIARLGEIVTQERTQGRARHIVQAARREVDLLETQIVESDDAIRDLNERIDRIPAIAEELAAIEQKEGVLRERYLASLRKVEDSQLAESLEMAHQGAQVSILERAGVPTVPERPSWLVALFGLAASVGLALALVVLLELVDPVVVTIPQLERIAEGPCLGSLPHVV